MVIGKSQDHAEPKESSNIEVALTKVIVISSYLSLMKVVADMKRTGWRGGSKSQEKLMT